MIKWIKSKLSMTFVKQNFLDTVNGKMVNNYIDCFGDKYMAQSRLGFRVKNN